MNLDPNNYTCHNHHADLTKQVQEALDNHIGAVAYLSTGLGQPVFRSFEVEVTCPGAAGGGPHKLICAGTYTL